MTLDSIMRDIEAMREDLLMFERKYGVPTEVFYEAYQRGEEPDDSAWVADWSQWAGSYQILQARLAQYNAAVHDLLQGANFDNVSQLIARTARHEPVAIPG